MLFRSLLFVPGDRPDRFSKALSSAADALILDLEDSVSIANKPAAREKVSAFLKESRSKPVLVRVNAISSEMIDADLSAILDSAPDGVVLPKAEGAHDITHLVQKLGANPPPVLPIATETPKALFGLGSYQTVSQHLIGMTWGAEDLPAAIGASSSRDDNGVYTPPFEWVRSKALFAAHAADTLAIDTVYPDMKDIDGLRAYANRGRRDGFNAMMAIHPSQCDVINQAYTPTSEELESAMRIVQAFEDNPGAGVLQIEGQMLDAPHLKHAKATLNRSIRLH